MEVALRRTFDATPDRACRCNRGLRLHRWNIRRELCDVRSRLHSYPGQCAVPDARQSSANLSGILTAITKAVLRP